MTMLPQVWFNGELLGTYETLKKLKKLANILLYPFIIYISI